jgi:hypothetical protein
VNANTLAAHISRLESARLATQSAMDAAGRSGDLAEFRAQRAELARIDASLARMHGPRTATPTRLGLAAVSPLSAPTPTRAPVDGRYRGVTPDPVSDGYARLARGLDRVIAEARAVLGARS